MLINFWDSARRRQDGEQQPHGIHDDVALPPSTFLAVSQPLASPPEVGGDRLAIDAGGGPGLVRLPLRSDLPPQCVMDAVKRAVRPLFVEIRQTVLLGGKPSGRYRQPVRSSRRGLR